MQLYEFIFQIFQGVFGKLTPVVLTAFLLLVIIGICAIIKEYMDYKNGSYYRDTHMPYLAVKFNLGRNGEYLTYHELEKYEKDGAKFLFNVYIPKGNGETTELDVVMICPSGIFVFESKNYSGWIFGSETRQYWYQTLPTGKKHSQKNSFYNPVLQNRSHIKHLQSYLGCEFNIPIHSVIVFSERCTLKDIHIVSSDIHVIKRDQLARTVSELYSQSTNCLTTEAIQLIYDALYRYTQVDELTKHKHITNIQANLSHTHIPHTPAVHPSISKDDSSTSAIPESDASLVDLTERKICPLCGADLVLRTARKGSSAGNRFWGCTAFPECRYTQNID